jgi:hypothetical protein
MGFAIWGGVADGRRVCATAPWRLTDGVIGYAGSSAFQAINTGVKICSAEKNDLDAGMALS